jgi:hypothetical protein
MAYIEDFLTNNCYRFISILLGFAFVFFTGIFDNSDRYYYLTPDQVIDNSTNYNDDDDMIYNNTNDNISYITVYDNSTIYRCEKILNSMHYYRLINAMIYTILFMCMSCFNFKILKNRKNFCNMFIFGTTINLLFGGVILLSEGVFKCYNIINEQYHYMQAIVIVNYLIMILVLFVFAEETYRKNRINRGIQFNQNENQSENQNINTNIFAIPAYLPKYSEITNDKPPSYQENYVITISPSAPLLQNRE